MIDPTLLEELAPNFKKALIAKAHTAHPFWNLLGMRLADIKKGWAVVELPFDPKLTQADGIAHGGATFSAADAAVAMALVGLIGRDETLVTLEMKLNYLKPFAGGTLRAEACVVQKGSRAALGEVRVTTDTNGLIAMGLATYMAIPKK